MAGYQYNHPGFDGGTTPRTYGKEETYIALQQAEKIAGVLTPRQREKLLAVLMSKIILDSGFDLLNKLIERVQKTTR